MVPASWALVSPEPVWALAETVSPVQAGLALAQVRALIVADQTVSHRVMGRLARALMVELAQQVLAWSAPARHIWGAAQDRSSVRASGLDWMAEGSADGRHHRDTRNNHHRKGCARGHNYRGSHVAQTDIHYLDTTNRMDHRKAAGTRNRLIVARLSG